MCLQCKDSEDTVSIPRSRRSPGGEHGNPLQYSCLDNPMDRGAWRATVHGVAQLNMTEGTEHACAHTGTPLTTASPPTRLGKTLQTMGFGTQSLPSIKWEGWTRPGVANTWHESALPRQTLLISYSVHSHGTRLQPQNPFQHRASGSPYQSIRFGMHDEKRLSSRCPR